MKKKKNHELHKKSYEKIELKFLKSKAEFERINSNLKEEIQRHHKTHQILQDTKARLASIVNSAMDAIISINSLQEIVLFNQAAEKMFLVKSEEVIGSPISRFLPDRFKEIHSDHIKKFGETGITNRSMGKLGTVFGIRNNGEEFPVEASISQAVVAGEKIYTVILRDITERNKYEAEIKSSLKEKEMLLKEIHHRVKNNMQVVSSLLNLQSNYIQHEGALEVFKESQNRLKAMALIHEKLYQSENLTTINIEDYIKDLSYKLFDSYRHRAKNIKLDFDIENTFVDVDEGIAIGLILNELVTNSLKHAFTSRPDGVLRIRFCRVKDKQLLIVEDNGIGLPRDYDFIKSETLGLQLVISLVDQHKGTIEYDGKNGAKFTIFLQN